MSLSRIEQNIAMDFLEGSDNTGDVSTFGEDLSGFFINWGESAVCVDLTNNLSNNREVSALASDMAELSDNREDSIVCSFSSLLNLVDV